MNAPLIPPPSRLRIRNGLALVPFIAIPLVSNSFVFAWLMATSDPLTRRVPQFVVIQPECGPRNDGSSQLLVSRPVAAPGQVDTEMLLHVHMGNPFIPATLQLRRKNLHARRPADAVFQPNVIP